MLKRNISVPPSNGSINGIFRYLSKVSRTPNLHGSSLIRISYDSFVDTTSYTYPIGYEESDKNSFFVSSGSSGEHWYQIDLLSFRITIVAYTYQAEPIHYPKTWQILASDDGVNWEIINEPTLSIKPEKNRNTFYLKEPKTTRILRMRTNSRRFDDAWDLTIKYLDIFGYVRIFTNTCKTYQYSRFSLFFLFFIW